MARLRNLVAALVLALSVSTASLAQTGPIDQVSRVIDLWRQAYAGTITLDDRRTAFDRMFLGKPSLARVSINEVSGAGMRGLMVSPLADAGGGRHVILYLHGGGFYSGSSRTHLGMGAALAQAAQCNVFLLDYPRVPEAVYPAQINSVVTAYRWLMQSGYAPSHIALAGESAGGNLVLEGALRIRDARLPAPAALIALSPVVDLAATGNSMSDRDATDPLIHRPLLLKIAAAYLNGTKPNDPAASPIYADLSGLPPLLVQVGSRETLLDDALRLARKAGVDGVPVQVEVWPGMIHQFQLFPDRIDDANRAIADIAQFLNIHFEKEGPSSRAASRSMP